MFSLQKITSFIAGGSAAALIGIKFRTYSLRGNYPHAQVHSLGRVSQGAHGDVIHPCFRVGADIIELNAAGNFHREWSGAVP